MASKERRMELEELLKTLDEEQVSVITKAITKERETGISKYRAKDKEVLKFKNALKEMGYDSTKQELDNFTRTVAKKGDSKEGDISTKALETKLSELEASLEKERNEARTAKITSKLSEGIGGKLINSRLIIKEAIENGSFDLDGDKLVYKDGDNVYDADKGFEAIMTTYKDAVITSQVDGTESTGGDSTDGSDISIEDLTNAFMED